MDFKSTDSVSKIETQTNIFYSLFGKNLPSKVVSLPYDYILMYSVQ